MSESWDFPEYDWGDEEDEYDEAWMDFDCGMTADGGCTKAGSEECDWDCPYFKDS